MRTASISLFVIIGLSLSIADAGAQTFDQDVEALVVKLGVVAERKASGGHHPPTFSTDDRAVPIGIRALSLLVLDYLAAGAR